MISGSTATWSMSGLRLTNPDILLFPDLRGVQAIEQQIFYLERLGEYKMRGEIKYSVPVYQWTE